jgi:hypothetical protein
VWLLKLKSVNRISCWLPVSIHTSDVSQTIPFILSTLRVPHAQPRGHRESLERRQIPGNGLRSSLEHTTEPHGVNWGAARLGEVCKSLSWVLYGY